MVNKLKHYALKVTQPILDPRKQNQKRPNPRRRPKAIHNIRSCRVAQTCATFGSLNLGSDQPAGFHRHFWHVLSHLSVLKCGSCVTEKSVAKRPEPQQLDLHGFLMHRRSYDSCLRLGLRVRPSRFCVAHPLHRNKWI